VGKESVCLFLVESSRQNRHKKLCALSFKEQSSGLTLCLAMFYLNRPGQAIYCLVMLSTTLKSCGRERYDCGPMRRLPAAALLLGFSLILYCCFAQPVLAQPSPANPPDPYKATLDRLQSLVTIPLLDWRFQLDAPHPEDPSLSDSDWQIVKMHEEWQTGPRVLRRWIEIPEKINGYATEGARVDLNLIIRSDDTEILTVFSNGGTVYRGDEDMQQPISLTQSAHAGQKFLVAVRIDCSNAKTSIFESQLTIHPPPNRPDPSHLRIEIMSAQPVIAAYEEGKAEREQMLDAASKAIDFSALERGDQAGFDRSLSDA